MSIDETFDILTVGERIRSACFFDGPEDRWIVQFFRWREGEIIRASYDRHTTKIEERRIPEYDWHHAELEKMYWGERLNYSI